jgi:hypothetical protein
VRARAFTALVPQTADDGHVVTVWFERLEDVREIEIPSGFRRRPFLLKRAVREVHEPEAWARRRGGLRQRRPCRDHGVQQRERNGRTGALQDLAPREMLLEQKHDYSPPSPSRLRKASLEMTPSTIDLKRY